MEGTQEQHGIVELPHTDSGIKRIKFVRKKEIISFTSVDLASKRIRQLLDEESTIWQSCQLAEWGCRNLILLFFHEKLINPIMQYAYIQPCKFQQKSYETL